MSEIEVQLKKGVLGLCVLALLSRRNSYAYEIASRMADAVDMGEGTIYPLMRRMQKDGLVSTYLEESPSGPPRKYYAITEAGQTRLAAQITEWRGFTAAVDELIAGDAPAATAPEPTSEPANVQEGESSHDAS
ncbi:PadR family transcriptional regulator [Novosphingobium decolorationis]|uniref:PadR family transcriptional regulator n=1 Tax=Novosphingobium decolorationis TaxID=2698673 RepID=A0ABX8E5U2_9SPHN|nr:PadR family transcriptional regulator [Novosphingobium decolorationis]QVM84483.1 PadR family transcriptional regulator [Novosphingobium decolorationis]